MKPSHTTTPRETCQCCFDDDAYAIRTYRRRRDYGLWVVCILLAALCAGLIARHVCT